MTIGENPSDLSVCSLKSIGHLSASSTSIQTPRYEGCTRKNCSRLYEHIRARTARRALNLQHEKICALRPPPPPISNCMRKRSRPQRRLSTRVSKNKSMIVRLRSNFFINIDGARAFRAFNFCWPSDGCAACARFQQAKRVVARSRAEFAVATRRQRQLEDHKMQNAPLRARASFN